MRLHTPELPEAVAAKLVEVIALVRELDLKKPPSIAESIDWARALLLLGADDIDEDVFRSTMSIIVKHRTDLDVVAERVGVRLGLALAAGVSLPARIVDFAEALRAEGLAVGTSELLDAFAALDEVPWTDRPAFREALAATLAKSPDDRRVFELVFERFFFRAAEEQAVARDVREHGRLRRHHRRRADRPRQPARAGDPGDPRRRRERDARPRAARDRGVRAPRRGLRRARRRRPADPPRARPARRAPAARGRRRAAHARPDPPLRAAAAARARARADRAHAVSCRPRGRSTSSTARSRRGRSRTSPPCTAS